MLEIFRRPLPVLVSITDLAAVVLRGWGLPKLTLAGERFTAGAVCAWAGTRERATRPKRIENFTSAKGHMDRFFDTSLPKVPEMLRRRSPTVAYWDLLYT
jgi:hypothetical protein